jgi:hypothetical protein
MDLWHGLSLAGDVIHCQFQLYGKNALVRCCCSGYYDNNVWWFVHVIL